MNVKSRVVTVIGPRGKLKRDFRHMSVDIIKTSPKTLKVEKWFGIKKELAAVRTVCSHIENMMKGVTLVSYQNSSFCDMINVSGLNYLNCNVFGSLMFLS